MHSPYSEDPHQSPSINGLLKSRSPCRDACACLLCSGLAFPHTHYLDQFRRAMNRKRIRCRSVCVPNLRVNTHSSGLQFKIQLNLMDCMILFFHATPLCPVKKTKKNKRALSSLVYLKDEYSMKTLCALVIVEAGWIYIYGKYCSRFS